MCCKCWQLNKTKDIYVAAWLALSEGIEYDSVEIIGANKLEFRYSIENEIWQSLMIKFSKSLENKIKQKHEGYRSLYYLLKN